MVSTTHDRLKRQILTQITDLTILWESDCPSDMEELQAAFRYHLIRGCKQEGVAVHKVSFIPSFNVVEITTDMQEVWRGRYLGCVHKINTMVWYHLSSTGEDYLLLSDKIWIVHNRNEHKSACYLYCKKGRNDRVKRPKISEAIIILIHTILAMYSRYTIHAAAVEIDGVAHVFMGESGHGKSTLCSDLASLGATFLGDDLVCLYSKDGRLLVGSLLLNAKLFPSSLHRHKTSVDVIEKYNGMVTLSSPIKGLYYIERTKKKLSGFKHLSSIDAMLRLIRSSNDIRTQYDAEAWHSLIYRMAIQLPYNIFFYGKRSLITLDTFRNA